MSAPLPSDDVKEELLLSCRYGDLDDIKQFVSTFGSDALNDIRDTNDNSVLHMVCANGHTDALDYLLSCVAPALLSAPNESGSTPLHWAATNAHLAIVQKLVRDERGPGVSLIDIKNKAGRSPLGEAENVGWEEGAQWLVEMMQLDDGAKEDDEPISADASQNIEVEIEDAEGRVAQMSIARGTPASATDTPDS